MSRIAYVNGAYVRHRDAAVHVEDRGYQFADGVYEVVAVAGGRMVELERHLRRLERSLGELRIAMPMPESALRHVLAEVIRRNRLSDGIVYLQITRGVARREHAFPKDVAPSMVITARRLKPPPADLVEKGVAVITIPDIRWKRCDIKSISLLPNVLGRQQAREAGAYEAWMVDEAGFVTEGTASNAWIVTGDGALVTRHLDQLILSGVTRLSVIDIAREYGLTPVERPFTVAEAKQAAEAFVTGTTAMVMPVVRIDGDPVGDGRPGPLARKLRGLYQQDLGA